MEHLGLTPFNFGFISIPNDKNVTDAIVGSMKQALVGKVDKEVFDNFEKLVESMYDSRVLPDSGRFEKIQNGGGKGSTMLSLLLTFLFIVSVVLYITHKEAISFHITEKMYKLTFGDQGLLCSAEQQRRAIADQMVRLQCQQLQTLEDLRNKKVQDMFTYLQGGIAIVGGKSIAEILKALKEGKGLEKIGDIYDFFSRKIDKDDKPTVRNGRNGNGRNGNGRNGNGRNGNGNGNGNGAPPQRKFGGRRTRKAPIRKPKKRNTRRH